MRARTGRVLLYLIGMLLSGIYILNPTAGVWEIIPDNLPIVGNLDEAAMVTLFLYCLRGIRRLRAASRELGAATPVSTAH